MGLGLGFVLAAPFWPSRPVTSPRFMSKVTSTTACTGWRPAQKVFFSPRATTSDVPVVASPAAVPAMGALAPPVPVQASASSAAGGAARQRHHAGRQKSHRLRSPVAVGAGMTWSKYLVTVRG